MQKLFAKIKKENLDAGEKAEILSNLESFVARNPVQEIKSPFYNPWLVYVRHKAFIISAVSAFFIVSLTSGTVLAAKNSLPGEKLYTIKMLDEKVQSLTALGDKAQAEVHTAQAVSRLQEIEQMATKKIPINKEIRQEIKNNFGDQTREIKNHIDELKNSGQTEDAAQIQSHFDSSVSEHEKAIIELNDDENKKSENHQGEVKGVETKNRD